MIAESPDEVPLDLDMLMTLDPLGLAKRGLDEKDMKEIIAYHRRIRAMKEQGKGRKAAATATAAKPKGIAELLSAKKSGGPVTRRGF